MLVPESNLVEKISKQIAEELSETIDYKTKEMLSEHDFLSVQEARGNGYEVVIEVRHREVEIKLCKVIQTLKIKA